MLLLNKILFVFTFMIMLSFIFLFKSINTQLVIFWNEIFKFSNLNLVFLFDFYSITFFMTIFLVGLLVFNFMSMYMYKDKSFNLFFFMTLIFIFSMLLLIFSMNLWTMIIGWEGLGLSSFYLIFFYNNMDAWISSVKTFINNKLGDSMLLISMILLSLMWSNNFNLFFNFNMIYYLLVFSLLTKSAQFPFMSWLPMAMAAPTPISSLVHSSTLVTAGLYILIRHNYLFKTILAMNFFSSLCLLSMLMSGLKAMIEKDMKKMIALSTLSQISLMFFFLTLNFKMLSFIYLCNHALFKSLMFINMGFLMMINCSNQHNLNMNIFNSMNMFLLSFKISCLNLMNMPFFSSFFIKEVLVLNLLTSDINMLKFFLFMFSSFFTMNYSLKFLTFFSHMNYKSKYFFNSINGFSFLILVTIFSLIFSFFMINNSLINHSMNIFTILLYILFLLINFKLYKLNLNFINDLMFLNFLMYKAPQKFFMKFKKVMVMDLWIEYMTLYSVIKFNNNLMNIKTFKMNFKLTLLFFILITYMLIY